jgi:hypothetical protein
LTTHRLQLGTGDICRRERRQNRAEAERDAARAIAAAEAAASERHLRRPGPTRKSAALVFDSPCRKQKAPGLSSTLAIHAA